MTRKGIYRKGGSGQGTNEKKEAAPHTGPIARRFRLTAGRGWGGRRRIRSRLDPALRVTGQLEWTQ